MRLGTKLLLIILLSDSVAVWAQERDRTINPDLLVRLSYQRSPLSDRGLQQICLTVSRAGNYRLIFWKEGKFGFEGKMTDDQLLHLKRLLQPQWRSMPRNEVGMIRDHSESFVAEISRIEMPAAFPLRSTVPSGPPRSAPGPPHWVKWLNADDVSPFPPEISRVITWMKAFDPSDGKAVDELEFSEVCPSVGLSFIQPSTASNKRP